MKSNNKIKFGEVKPATKREKLSWEKELLGLFVSSNPLEDFRVALEKRTTKVSELTPRTNHRIKIGGIISKIKKIITKSGRPMLFMNVEDFSAKIEVVVFPGVIDRNPAAFQENKIVLVSGKVDMRDGIPKLICDEIEEVIEG